MRHRLLAAFGTAVLTAVAGAQTWDREHVNFLDIEELARGLASRPYEPPDRETLPGWMKDLTYDQYRDIRFRTEEALWSTDQLPFRAMLFHPGYLFREPVELVEFTDTHRQDIRFAEAFFDYGPLVPERSEIPSNAGFAGFRLHAPLNRPDYFDELVVFQGASYWRALGRGQRYGISARGIAIDTGAEGVTEEFPSFRKFWLRKPKPDTSAALVYALLDGPSVTGAYGFIIEPGEDTVVTVRATLFPRKEVKRFGLAPMSSMFWFGENSRRRFDDFRPEVHDSDGLAIRMGSGERIWRPISNDSGQLEFSFFRMEKCEGFGLLQRDRRFGAYEDGEAAYELRPSLWIEPTSDWGPGSVMLMEIPTGNELADNTVAMWEPAIAPKVGEKFEFSYKQYWTMRDDPSEAGGRVVATRTGVHEWQPGQRTMIVEFAGGALEGWSGPTPEAVVEALGDNRSKVKIQGIAVQRLPEGRWRVGFQIAPAENDVPLSEIGPVELRCSLKSGGDFLTETWAYRIIP